MKLLDYLKSVCDFEGDVDNIERKLMKLILLCQYRNGSDMDLFFKHIPDVFQYIIIVLPSHCSKVTIDDRRVILKIYNNTDENIKTLLQTARLIQCKWVCFINTDEHFDQRFTGYNDIETSNLKFLPSNKINIKNDYEYYSLKNTNHGIFQEIRIFNLNECLDEEIINPISLYNQCTNLSNILIISQVNINDGIEYNLFTSTCRIGAIYRAANEFRNVDIVVSDEVLQNLIEQKIGLILKYFLTKESNANGPGLLTGYGGLALLMSIAFLKTGDNRFKIKLNGLLDLIDDNLLESERVSPSYCDGVAGYGWLLCHLSENKLIELDLTVLNDLDDILIKVLKDCCLIDELDQMHAGVSIGRYFLKRRNVEMLSFLIQNIERQENNSFNEIKFPSRKMSNNRIVFDFGLAHGIAGKLYFLGKCYRMGVEIEKCLKLIRGVFDFYVHNEQCHNTYNSFFPPFVDCDSYAPLSDSKHSRLAWCYGDLGILYSIYLCGKHISDVKMQDYAISKLQITASRLDMQETYINDAGLCHGASGVAYIFNKMYFFTGLKEFREAAVYWYKVTIIMGSNKTDETGYVFGTNDGWTANDSMLEGKIGVCLSLLSVDDYKYIEWDESMMLS